MKAYIEPHEDRTLSDRDQLCDWHHAWDAIRTSVAAANQAPSTAQPAASQGSGNRGGLAFTEPSPLDFDDHAGYISIFDGKTLDGWDGNPKFWRVKDGAIVGESTPERPSSNSYIAYRRLEA